VVYRWVENQSYCIHYHRLRITAEPRVPVDKILLSVCVYTGAGNQLFPAHMLAVLLQMRYQSHYLNRSRTGGRLAPGLEWSLLGLPSFFMIRRWGDMGR
jgi:hypothetical protein